MKPLYFTPSLLNIIETFHKAPAENNKNKIINEITRVFLCFHAVRAYDNATTCGLVWTPNFVAYRCRTCGISPCMSLCTECFKKGNHHRHDFNMFLSQAGGACDCGDTSVMKETGYVFRRVENCEINKYVTDSAIDTVPINPMLIRAKFPMI